ncbi:MAG: hypothetical protein FJ098_17355, partial [Deltaproteobacteria bacterium]|nr:hypothetical protein [Deltaproteobacteria bacterium]
MASSLESALSEHLLGGRASADVAHVLLAGVTVFVFWASLPAWASLSWFGLFVATAGARGLNRARALRRNPGPGAVLSLVRRDVWIAASLWGGWALLHVGADPKGLLFLLL